MEALKPGEIDAKTLGNGSKITIEDFMKDSHPPDSVQHRAVTEHSTKEEDDEQVEIEEFKHKVGPRSDSMVNFVSNLERTTEALVEIRRSEIRLDEERLQVAIEELMGIRRLEIQSLKAETTRRVQQFDKDLENLQRSFTAEAIQLSEAYTESIKVLKSEFENKMRFRADQLCERLGDEDAISFRKRTQEWVPSRARSVKTGKHSTKETGELVSKEWDHSQFASSSGVSRNSEQHQKLESHQRMVSNRGISRYVSHSPPRSRCQHDKNMEPISASTYSTLLQWLSNANNPISSAENSLPRPQINATVDQHIQIEPGQIDQSRCETRSAPVDVSAFKRTPKMMTLRNMSVDRPISTRPQRCLRNKIVSRLQKNIRRSKYVKRMFDSDSDQDTSSPPRRSTKTQQPSKHFQSLAAAVLNDSASEGEKASFERTCVSNIPMISSSFRQRALQL